MSRRRHALITCLVAAGLTLGCGASRITTDTAPGRVRLPLPPMSADTGRLLPMLHHRAAIDSWERDVLRRPFTGEAEIVYVVDGAESVHYLMTEDLDTLGLNAAEVHYHAVQNLNRRAKDMHFAPVQGGPVYLLGLDGYYDASLLLSPLATAIVRRILGADPAICAAGRGAVLVTAWGRHPLDRLSAACQDAFDVQRHPVSASILVPGDEPGSWRSATDSR